MGIRLAVTRVAAGLVVAGAGGLASGQALAQANVLKECGTQYQAAKAANELGGQGWQDFLKACRTRLKEAAPAAEAKPAETKPAETKPAEAQPVEAAKPAEAAKPVEAPEPAAETKPAVAPAPAAAPAAAPDANPLKPAATEAAAPAKDSKQTTQARQKKCAAEWKANKKDLLKENAKMTWPKYWSACNKKLKEAGE
jgi:outer membrane biosynthesis protein TonB